MSTQSIRVYPELRSVHVDRHAVTSPARVIYFSEKYDLGDRVLPGSFRRVGLAAALRLLWRADELLLELPEPLWIRTFPRTALLAAVWKVGGLLRGRTRRTVTYAMEVSELRTLLTGRARAPKILGRAVGILVGAYLRATHDRICFASETAAERYRSMPFVRSIEHRTILELPAAVDDLSEAGDGERVVFVGLLAERNGLGHLLRTWDLVQRERPDAVLTVVGDGPMMPDVERWVAEDPLRRECTGLVSRAAVREVIRASDVLVAPSVPEGRWREQIGLPIKEALAEGRQVVTTDQTGLAPWLAEHGHRVVPVERVLAEDGSLARAVVGALEHPVSASSVVAALPSVDGRLRSDAWLHAVGPGDVTTIANPWERAVVIVNPLGKALEHYTKALRHSLGDGPDVSVIAFPEPSAGGGRVRWVVDHLRALLRAGRVARRSGGAVIVTWPVLGHLDLALIRSMRLGSRAALVVHDPEPLVRAYGYSAAARAVGAVARGRTRIVAHSTAAAQALADRGTNRVETVPHPVLPPPVAAHRASERPAGSGRPVVRVLGQFKPDRSLAVLEQIAAASGGRWRLEVIGRGWPAVRGWRTEDAFVPEERLDELITGSDAVLVPYRRFWQSGIANRCLELGTAFVGPRDSALADLVGPDAPTLVRDADDPAAWIDAVDVAVRLGDVGARLEAATAAARRAADGWAVFRATTGNTVQSAS